MALTTKLTDAEIGAIAAEVFARELADTGLERLKIRSDDDQGGEASIFVTLVMRPDAPFIPGERLAYAHLKLHDALDDQHEGRFAHLSYEWLGQDEPTSSDIPT